MSRQAIAGALFMLMVSWVVAACPRETVLDKYRCQPPSAAASLDHTPPRFAQQPGEEPVADETMRVRVQLPIRNRAALVQRLRDQHDPKSPHYRRFLTREMFHDEHGAEPIQALAVQNHLRRYGLSDARAEEGGTITASGRAPHFEQAFGTKLRRFQDASGDVFIAPSATLAPLPVPVLAAHGLSTPPRRLSHLGRAEANGQPLTPATLRKAYNLPDAATAEGQTVGVLALDGFKTADLRAFADRHRLPMPTIRTVNVNHYDGRIQSESGQIETTMDLQILMAARPKEIVVFAAANTQTAFVDVLRRIANPPKGEPLVRIVSCSWGSPEVSMSPAELAAQEELLMQMAAQGQTLIVAAGDSGAKDDMKHVGVDSPASSPHVLAVGGTTLHVKPDQSWSRETVWWRAGLGGEPDSGTGGGISCVYEVPSWQRPTLTAAQGAVSKVYRNLPDVSLCADPAGPGYEVIVEGRACIVGGTSCAAPAMAGILATVEAQRARAGKAPLGFYTPAIYAVGTAQPTIFHDIMDGNTNGLYSALPGYDDATGFGSVDGAAFIKVLTEH